MKTVQFHMKETKASPSERKIVVSSKATTEKQADGTEVKLPPKFPPFALFLDAEYCKPINSLPEAIREVVFKSLDELIRAIASSRKTNGFESVILSDDAFLEFTKAGESSKLTLANIEAFFDQVVGKILPASDSKTREAWKAQIKRLAQNSVPPKEANIRAIKAKLLTLEGKPESEAGIYSRLLEQIEKLLADFASDDALMD